MSFRADILASLARPLLDAFVAPSVCLVGGDVGTLGRFAAIVAARDDASLRLVGTADVHPRLSASLGTRFDVRAAEWGTTGPELPVADIFVFVGEPSAAYVGAGLGVLSAREPRPAVIVAGTGWPHGRRDAYPEDSIVPIDLRRPARRGGLLPGTVQPLAQGLHSEFLHATAEGGPDNGVMSAVEAFADGWARVDVSLAGGVTVLVPDHLDPAALQALESKELLHDLLDSAERGRIDGEAQLHEVRLALAAEQAAAARAASELAVAARDTSAADDLQRQLSSRDDAFAASEARVQHLAGELRATSREVEKLRAHVSEQRDAAAADRRTLREDVKVAAARVDAIASELDAERQRAALLEEQVEDAQALRRVAAERARVIAEVQSQLAASEEGRSSLRGLAAEFQEEISALAAQVRQLEAALQDRRRDLDEARRDAQQLEAQLRRAEEGLASQRRRDEQVRELLARTQSSSTWRIGSRMVRIGRALTFRGKPKGSSALALAINELEPPTETGETSKGVAMQPPRLSDMGVTDVATDVDRTAQPPD